MFPESVIHKLTFLGEMLVFRFASIDLETGGLGLYNSVLQFACVLDDPHYSCPWDCPSLDVTLKHDNYSMSSDFNKFGLLEQCLDVEFLKDTGDHWHGNISVDELIEVFANFLITFGWDKKEFIVAGKNFRHFDYERLKKINAPFGESFTEFFPMHYRFLDVGSMYYKNGKIPSLSEIMEEIDGPSVIHDALEDARCVVLAARVKDEENR